jgi:hypothetical protein
MGTKALHQGNSKFQSHIMGIILPPIQRDGKTYIPGINDYFDAPRGTKIHGGIDLNYHYENGGKVGQNGVNLSGETVHAPVNALAASKMSLPTYGEIR